jgi:hypothetical protein
VILADFDLIPAQIDGLFQALTKANKAFSQNGRFVPEKLTIYKQTYDGKGTQLYRVDADCGWAEVIVATDLYPYMARAIAHALDAVYRCGVYTEDGELL